MQSMVTTEDDGKSTTHVGITICKGPGRYRLVLTHPYHDAGRIIEIPTEDIASIQSVSPGTLGEDPKPVP